MIWPDDYINKVICGDCLEVMKGIPDGAVDIIVTSPPFNVGKDYGKYSDDSLSDEGYDALLSLLCGEVSRLTGVAAYIFIGTNRMVQLGTMLPVYQWLFWHRPNIVHKSFKMAWIPTITPIAMVAPRGRPKMQRAQIDTRTFSLIVAASPQSSFTGDMKRVHVCQDPLNAVRPLIARTVGDIILDPFAGSGTTLVAAKQLGRKYIGIEINPDYCKIAEDRLRQEELF